MCRTLGGDTIIEQKDIFETIVSVWTAGLILSEAHFVIERRTDFYMIWPRWVCRDVNEPEANIDLRADNR